MNNCNCPLHGPCSRFGFSGRRADICKGIVLSPGKCERYIANWLKLETTPYRKVMAFTQEQARWVAAGFPVRSQEEIDQIMETCLTCEHVKGGATKEKLTCSLCGCTCKKSGKLGNKAAMATAHCPLSKW